MAAPAQAELPLATPTRCPVCGRDWTGVLDELGAVLEAVLRLPLPALEEFTRCWFGACGEARGA
jgi:hypothetical protein